MQQNDFISADLNHELLKRYKYFLKKAIEEEDYQRAITLREKIKILEEKILKS